MSVASASRQSSTLISDAAAWAAELDAGELDETQRLALQSWREAHPDHGRTLDRMLGLNARFERLDGAGRRALRAVALKSARGRGRGAALLGLTAVVLAGVAGLQSFTVRAPFAAYSTAAEPPRRIALQDGSHVALDAASAADFRQGARERRVSLYRGQVFVKVAKDASRPFVVETRHGTATALGTAYVVRDDGEAAVVSVVESRVRVCARARAERCLDLSAGQRARVTRRSVDMLGRFDPAAGAVWAEGWLEADDLPLAEALEALNRYRSAPIAYDAEALASLSVTGSFPLEDGERALEALAQAAPVRVIRGGDGVRIAPRG